MKLAILMFGSYGDHVPTWEIAKEAQRRGHDVTVIGHAKYLARLDPAPIEAHSVVSVEENSRGMSPATPWREKISIFRNWCVNFLRRSFDILRPSAARDDLVLLSPHGPGGLTARICRELFHTPVLEFYVDPFPTLGPGAGWSARLLKWFLHRSTSRLIRGELAAFRSAVGLPPVRDLSAWAASPLDVGCGFFPDFVAQARPFESPCRRFLTPGFIPRDPALDDGLPEAVRAFLDAGPPPVVVAQPSWAVEGSRFEAETCAALASLGLRGVFPGSPGGETSTPDVLRVPFVSYPPLLARSRAFIHHGGAGTAGAALLAGIPQLIVPQLPMQSDFGVRLQTLGVGDSLVRAAYRRRRIERTLQSLMESPTVAERCRDYAARLREPGRSSAALCCDELESLHRERETTRDRERAARSQQA